MKNFALTLLILLAISPTVFSQNVGINSTGSSPDASAMLDVSSNTKGFLLPRMTTTEQNAIVLPATGLAVYNTTLNSFQVNTGTPASPVWSTLTTSSTTNAWSIGGNSVASVQNIGTITNFDFPFITNNTEKMRLTSTGNLGIGLAPTAVLHLKAGTIAANTAPLKFTSGPLLTAPAIGAVEFLTDKFYGTITSSTLRKEFTLNESVLTNARVPFGLNGRLTDLAAFTYTTNRLSPTYITLGAGAAAAGSAPLIFTSGINLTTAVAGAMEFTTDNPTFTITTGLARKQFTLNDIPLTLGRVPFNTTNGRLTDLPAFTYSTNRLSPTYVTLGAGTAAAGGGPLVFTSGINLTVPTAGAVEFDGTHFYGTVGATRYQFDQQAGTTYTGSNGITLVGNDFRNNLITGITGGQTVIGGTAAGNSLTLSSTSHATKGNIIFGTSAYNELNNRLGLGNAAPTEALDITGNIKFSGALMPNNLPGTAGNFLTSGGAGVPPTWVTFDPANNWSITGNASTNSGINFLGTTDNKSLKFRTNNIQRMRIDSTGNVAIGQDVFDVANPEKFVVNAGVTNSVNAFLATGSINSYLQINVKNTSNGTNATSDVVATADNGTETTNYVDFGINSSTYTGGAIETGLANDGYLISSGNDFYMVNSSANKSMLFLTGGTGITSERMRILANGRVGMGIQDPTAPFVIKDTMEIRRLGALSQLLFTNTGVSGDLRIASDSANLFLQGGGGRGLQMGSYWGTILGGDRQTTAYPAFVNSPAGTGVLVLSQRDASIPLAIQANSATQTGNLTQWRNSAGTVLSAVNKDGYFGIGNFAPSEKLDVTGNMKFSGALMPNNLAGTTGDILTSTGSGTAPTWAAAPGNQTITFAPTGDVTGSTTGTTTLAPALTIGALKVTNSMLAGSIASSKLIGTDISTVGTVTAGTWNATAIGVTKGGSGLTAVTQGDILYASAANTITALPKNATATRYLSNTGASNNPAWAQINLANGVTGNLPVANLNSGTSASSSTFWRGDGTWVNPSSTNWSLTGNSGTNLATNFLGTTDLVSLRFRTNNIQGMLLDSAGNVSIGNAPVQTPGIGSMEKFLVDAGSTAANPTNSINVISGKGYLNSYLQLNIQNKSSGNAASSDVVATNDAGTEANGINFVDMGINSSNYSTANSSILNGINTGYLYSTGADFVIGNATASKNLLLFTGGTAQANERMRISGSGNVGIGTSSPAFPLDVAGIVSADSSVFVDANNTNSGTKIGGLFFGGGGSGEVIASKRTAGGNQYGLDFYTSSNNRMSINSGGNVGIGTTSPATALHIVKSNSGSNVLILQNTSTSGYSSADFFNNAGAVNGAIGYANASVANGLFGDRTFINTSTNDFLLTTDATTGALFVEGSNNNVGIGTTTPAYKLSVAGITAPTANNSYTLGTSTNRWSTIYAQNALNTSSDRRLKTNISNLNYGLKELIAIQPVSYNWKATPDTDKKLGLIAQDVRKIIPEVVKGDESKETLSISYTDLIPVLINAIKEQQKQIDALNKDIQLLKAKK